MQEAFERSFDKFYTNEIFEASIKMDDLFQKFFNNNT